MRTFKHVIVRTLALFLCVCMMCLVVVEGYFHTKANDYQDAENRKALAGTLDTLVIGASSTMDGFVPSIYDEHFHTSTYNLAMAMITMKGRYQLLKKEIERNPIDTLYFEVSRNTFMRNRAEEFPEGDIYELGRWDSIGERIRYFVGNFSFDEYGSVFHDAFQKGINGWKTIVSGADVDETYKDTFGYKPLDYTDISLTPDEARKIYHSDHLETAIVDENIAYFEKILSLCKENNIKVVLFTVPVSERYILTYDDYDEIYQMAQTIASEYGLDYYDFNLYKGTTYSQEADFSNDDHMSRNGAAKFTNVLVTVLDAVKRGEDVSDQFYASYHDLEQVMLENLRFESQPAS